MYIILIHQNSSKTQYETKNLQFYTDTNKLGLYFSLYTALNIYTNEKTWKTYIMV